MRPIQGLAMLGNVAVGSSNRWDFGPIALCFKVHADSSLKGGTNRRGCRVEMARRGILRLRSQYCTVSPREGVRERTEVRRSYQGVESREPLSK